ncbi:MAG: M28 family peptidase [Ignavibacteriales bacterium]|nr:M28 family peptidase [Ignavibacteriales bacterium]
MTSIRGFLAAVVFFGIVFNVSAQHPKERAFAQKVSQTSMRNHVRNLVASGNRLGGTPSGDKSTDYVSRSFKRSGLATMIEVDPEKLVSINHEWQLQVMEPRRLRQLIRNEWLGGYSPSVSRTTAPLQLLEQEEGVTSELSGAAVLTERQVTDRLYQSLVNAGVVCILSYAPADSTLYSDWAMISDLRESNANAIPLFNLSYGNGTRLRKELDQNTPVTIRFMSRTTITSGSPKTVVATLPGKSGKYYLVCAHGDSDSGGPGADDNASGVAGVLELARVFSSMMQSGQLSVPEKSIKFVIWGSEYYSTEHYVKRHQEQLEEILGVLNYDEIGTGASRDCLYFESNDVPYHEDLMKIFNAVGEEYVDKPGFWKEATTNPSQGGTDSYVFMPEYLDRLDVPRATIPSITIYTAAWNRPRTIPQTPGWTSRAWKGHPDSVTIDYSRYYHSSLDIPERTTEREPFNMSWAVKAVGIALLRLAW